MPLQDAHALVIGVSQYAHVAPLRETQDAADIAATLEDPRLCGYPPGNVRLLLEGQATRAAILHELDALAERADERSTVFLYFSGHGARAAVESGHAYYLLPVDGRATCAADLEASAISSGELTARLAAIPSAKLTIVLDCCRAAELAEADLPLPSADLTAEAVGPLAHGRGRAVLAASRGDGSAYAFPGQVHSVFTGHLLRGLRGEASGVAGVIRICDLFHYVQQHVAQDEQGQRPIFKAELEENYPVALLRGGQPAPLELPPPPDDLPYDVFVTYCHDDVEDRAWTRAVVVPFLEGQGLRVCLERRDFRLGASRLAETGRAVAQSRFTVAVFTPAYLASDFEHRQAMLAAHAADARHAPRFIPLVRRPCALALEFQMTAILDASRDEEVPAALARLATTVRAPALTRLSG
ncbi:MAG: caspase family protein [Kofleriaceae bacterium]